MAVSIPYTTTWVSNQILTAAALNQNFLDVESITGLGTANLDANAGITGAQLGVGAAVNTAASAAINLNFDTTGGAETTVVTLPSITTRGGRVVVFGFGGLHLAVNTAASTALNFTWRVYRDASVVATTLFENLGSTAVLGAAGALKTAVTLPMWSEVPSAGAHVYKITVQANSASANVAIVSSTANAGTAFVVELS